MLSRVAENLYWISRYVERAENVARLLDVGFHLELDAAGPAGDVPASSAPIESVLTILACREPSSGPTAARPARPRGGAPLPDLRPRARAVDPGMLGRARENARATQETLSGEAWSQLNRLYLYLGSRKARAAVRRQPARGSSTGSSEPASCSTAWSTAPCPRTEVYHFLQLGRYLERVNQISRILNVKLHGLREGGPVAEPPLRIVHWSSLLRSCSAYEAYLRELPRPGRSRGGGPLPGPRRRLPPRDPVLRGPLPASRSARSPAATTTATAPRPSAGSAGSTASCATSTSTRSSTGASATSSPASRTPATGSATRSTRRISSPDPTRPEPTRRTPRPPPMRDDRHAPPDPARDQVHLLGTRSPRRSSRSGWPRRPTRTRRAWATGCGPPRRPR